MSSQKNGAVAFMNPEETETQETQFRTRNESETCSSGFPGCQSDINRNKTRVRKETDKILESECSAFNGEEFKTRSQIILKMMYFFQVLPFYLLQFCSGMSVGYPSILVPQLIASNSTGLILDDSSKGWIVSLDYVMTALIALISGQLQTMFGPKKTSLLACFPICLSWFLMAVAPNMPTILTSRLLVGLGNGILTSSVYIVEVVSPDNRGSVVMIETAFRSLGMIFVYLMGALMDWQTLAWIVVPIPIVALIYGLFIPESPIYLSQRKGYTQLEDDAPPQNISWKETKHSLHHTIQMFKRREVICPLLLLFVVLVAQQCSAMKVIQGYAVEIFADVFSNEKSGVKEGQSVDTDAYWSAVIMGSVRLVATLLAAKYIRNFGRKTMYFLSAFLTIVFEIAFGFIDFFNLGARFKALPIIIISCQVFSLQLGVQTFPNLLSAELFPNDARARCKGLVRAVSSLMSFAMLKIFPYLETHFGLHGSFWTLAAILILSLPVIFIFVPEPKDISLDEVGQFFLPAKTIFYSHILSSEEIVTPTPEESFGRIRMIENCFGSAGRRIQADHRILLAEGMLSKKSHGKTRRRHFFLFNDILMWGSVLRENLNLIRQKIEKLENIQVEDIKGSIAWRIITPGKTFLLEATCEAEKLQWMMLIHYAKLGREKTASTQTSSIADTPKKILKEDPVIHYANIATNTSNLAVNQLYQMYENESIKKISKK
ncbi:facilitated trehalose transporter Tret1-2 homolog [Eurytemora carolleeae]|uniref:facilitated trehalose transporter Tret1-2 homolog n=1 Tax=Eurytemora carolleeae TaxID=1294199 RepID=UPI000C7620E6|nr:facilitated trehalose transporter Tret1-2 homolog [Eurytemora carolleeae]|eukprot:XP_023349580.1 facilitated trehalose transporter Tret1-2 homolog [Eurytemora affinis]